MEVFNAPAPDFSCERREASTVTPQVFSLFHSKASYARALALAARVVKETPTDRAAIERCFRLTCGRVPGEDEVAACLAHWNKCQAEPAPHRAHLCPTAAGSASRGHRGKHRRKVFLHREAARQRGLRARLAAGDVLAEVCLVIFNTNDFAYVY
ncbi:MAG: DUF1553 domain-containing protein [Chthoniobacter sp.]